MTWIKTIDYEDSSGTLRVLYDRIKGPQDDIKYVLHHPRNELPKSYLETIGVYVSMLNRCQYCVEHHFAGLTRLLSDDDRAAEIRQALEDGNPAAAFSGRELAGLQYAERLTVAACELTESDIDALRAAGFDDGEILEINQVTAYFAYANRTVLGLGINTDGDIIGLSPGDSDDPDNWSHR
jgi:uncharacterized peroxidase-related enzyme